MAQATLEVEVCVIGVECFELGANSDGISAGFCRLSFPSVTPFALP